MRTKHRIYPPAKKVMSLRLRPELIAIMRTLADQNEQTVTDLIEQAVEAHIANASAPL